jgi:hypothetical protein
VRAAGQRRFRLGLGVEDAVSWIGPLVMIVAGIATWDGVKYIVRRAVRRRQVERARFELRKDQFRANERRRAEGGDQ